MAAKNDRRRAGVGTDYFSCRHALIKNRFSHVITHSQRQDKPAESGGGILADEMGMGKSLTTLVLIGKTTRDARQWAAHSDTLPKSALAGKPCRATLLIVPQQCTLTCHHDISID